MKNFLISVSCLAILVGCGSASSEDAAPDESELGTSRGASYGATCGNGVFGTPRIKCAAGLECDLPNGTAPTGPDGSSSGSTGKCRAAKGATCGNGVFGTPSIACASTLECEYPSSTAPTGPDGGSSARTGKCVEKSAPAAVIQCSSGTYGTPNMPCPAGLVCKYPDSTAPTGPDGASSARTGTCEQP